MRKNFLAVALIFAIAAALCPKIATPAVAAERDFVIVDGVLTTYKGPGGDVVIPDGVKTIKTYAFNAVDIDPDVHISSITIPASVTSLEPFALAYLPGPDTFIVSEANPNFTSVDGVLFSKDRTTLIRYPASNAATTYGIPSGVTTIDDGAFFFNGQASSLTKITIPTSVTDIRDTALGCNDHLESIEVDGNNASYTSIDGVLYSKDGSTLLLYPACRPLPTGTYVIPDHVQVIGGYAFYACSDLTDIVIPDHVYLLGQSTFAQCRNLKNVTLPKDLTYIDQHLFEGCYSLTEVTIPDGVTTIWPGAFWSCKNLQSVIIPDSVQSIWTEAFYGCSSLRNVDIPEGVTAIERSSFWNCDLVQITIPRSVSRIEDRAFCGCFELADVYYSGNEADWKAIAINWKDNEPLASATIHYAYDPKPDCPGEPAESICSGTFGESNELSFTYKSDGAISFTGDIPQGETVFVACYDDVGRFTGVKCVDRQTLEAQVGTDAAKLKLFWLGGNQAPRCGTQEVTLTP